MSWRGFSVAVLVPAILATAACTHPVPEAAGHASAAPPAGGHRKVGAVLRVVEMPGAPTHAGIGFGSLWVSVAQDNGGSLVRVDPATGKVRATISVGEFPVGVAAGFGSIWATAYQDGTVARIDPATNTVTATIPVGPNPAEIAVDGGRVWVGDQDATVVALDPTTNRRTQAVLAGAGVKFRTIVAGAGSIWTHSAGVGITRIDSATGEVVATIRIPRCCDGDLRFADGVVWAASAADGRMYRIDPATNRADNGIDIGPAASGFLIAGGKLWVTHENTTVVSWHDLASGRRLGTATLAGSGFVGAGSLTDDKSVWFVMLDRGAVVQLAAA